MRWMSRGGSSAGIARVVTCANARCTNAEPWTAWVFAGGKEGRFDDQGTVAPVWQQGDIPAFPTPEIAVAPYDPSTRGGDDPVLLYEAPRGPEIERARCGKLAVWTMPRAGAVVEHTGKPRFAWLFVDRAGDSELVGGRCFGDDIAVFDAASFSIVADVKTGHWITMAADTMSEAVHSEDPAAALHEALRGVE